MAAASLQRQAAMSGVPQSTTAPSCLTGMRARPRASSATPPQRSAGWSSATGSLLGAGSGAGSLGSVSHALREQRQAMHRMHRRRIPPSTHGMPDGDIQPRYPDHVSRADLRDGGACVDHALGDIEGILRATTMAAAPVKRRECAEVADPAAAHLDAHICRLMQQIPAVQLHPQTRLPQSGRNAVVSALSHARRTPFS